jgi:hypothetical protein
MVLFVLLKVEHGKTCMIVWDFVKLYSNKLIRLGLLRGSMDGGRAQDISDWTWEVGKGWLERNL